MGDNEKYIFRRTDSIGSSAAEDDSDYLDKCFVDTGHLKILTDCSDCRSIVVGRTGIGKTAILKRIAEEKERVIAIEPENLAITYISNSTILAFLSELGVNLDIFFKLLWRHVFVVEIIKHKFNIESESDKRSFFETITDKFKTDKERRAIGYLREWGEKFWEETDSRVKEVTSKLESEITGTIKSEFPGVSLTSKGMVGLGEEEKEEIVQRIQYVVNRVQIKQLSEILDLLNSILSDHQKQYYITIDRLDEKWIESNFRYRLIRALIETAKDFHKIQNAKIIVAIRLDLIERVFRLTRDDGFQEEKYESLYLYLNWDNQQLAEVLDKRIDYLIRHRYTKKKITYKDILPKKIKNKNTINYICERTMMRPRDIILFFNDCIKEAINRASITETMVLRAEGEYARGRLNSLFNEWSSDYPNLSLFVDILKSRSRKFCLKDITSEIFSDFCLTIAIKSVNSKDTLWNDAFDVAEGRLDPNDFRKKLFLIFYLVGLVGLKIESFDKPIWSISGRRGISSAEITEETCVDSHPMFWRVLGASE